MTARPLECYWDFIEREGREARREEYCALGPRPMEPAAAIDRYRPCGEHWPHGWLQVQQPSGMFWPYYQQDGETTSQFLDRVRREELRRQQAREFRRPSHHTIEQMAERDRDARHADERFRQMRFTTETRSARSKHGEE